MDLHANGFKQLGLGGRANRLVPRQGVRPFPRLPDAIKRVALRNSVRPANFILSVSVAAQRMSLFEKCFDPSSEARFPPYQFRRRFVISTSRFGIGQVMDSNQTPLGLHRISSKIGGGHPVGTIFKSRRAVGLTWQGEPEGAIVHRILWLEGLEPGLNRGGKVDTYRRYIYIHGYGDELTLGQPRS